MALLRRFGLSILAVVAFNLAMTVVAWTGHEPVDAPFLVAWIAGDFVVSLTALALTERP
jgi:hypothetical protein